ncbi:MAG: uracil-DNA glycosylase [Sphingobacteriaceae bacterium]
MLHTLLHNSWHKYLSAEFDKPYFLTLNEFVSKAYSQTQVYPPKNLLFNAFELCPFENVKAVLIGQDPYHGPGQANGLCFSVNDGIALPPSLRNIFKELKSDLDVEIPINGNLEKWAKEGVLMLNAILTVEGGKPGSHKQKGWEIFTNTVIKLISDQKEHVVFLLWGNFAFEKEKLIDASKHLILKAAHPSPLARGAFFGSKPFSKTNAYLKQNGKKEIDWHLDLWNNS